MCGLRIIIFNRPLLQLVLPQALLRCLEPASRTAVLPDSLAPPHAVQAVQGGAERDGEPAQVEAEVRGEGFWDCKTSPSQRLGQPDRMRCRSLPHSGTSSDLSVVFLPQIPLHPGNSPCSPGPPPLSALQYNSVSVSYTSGPPWPCTGSATCCPPPWVPGRAPSWPWPQRPGCSGQRQL